MRDTNYIYIAFFIKICYNEKMISRNSLPAYEEENPPLTLDEVVRHIEYLGNSGHHDEFVAELAASADEWKERSFHLAGCGHRFYDDGRQQSDTFPPEPEEFCGRVRFKEFMHNLICGHLCMVFYPESDMFQDETGEWHSKSELFVDNHDVYTLELGQVTPPDQNSSAPMSENDRMER